MVPTQRTSAHVTDDSAPARGLFNGPRGRAEPSFRIPPRPVPAPTLLPREERGESDRWREKGKGRERGMCSPLGVRMI